MAFFAASPIRVRDVKVRLERMLFLPGLFLAYNIRKEKKCRSPLRIWSSSVLLLRAS
jgi:hypothetical protein